LTCWRVTGLRYCTLAILIFLRWVNFYSASFEFLCSFMFLSMISYDPICNHRVWAKLSAIKNNKNNNKRKVKKSVANEKNLAHLTSNYKSKTDIMKPIIQFLIIGDILYALKLVFQTRVVLTCGRFALPSPSARWSVIVVFVFHVIYCS